MKELPTNDVLGVVTGRLLGDIGGIYEVLNYMTGESLFTHQLPRIADEARPVILAKYPMLQQAIDEAEQVTTKNWSEWRDRWLGRYGPVMAIPKLTTDEHERIDPLSEAAEYFPPDRIITVKT